MAELDAGKAAGAYGRYYGRDNLGNRKLCDYGPPSDDPTNPNRVGRCEITGPHAAHPVTGAGDCQGKPERE